MPVWSGTLISQVILKHWSKYKDMLLEPVQRFSIFHIMIGLCMALNLPSLQYRQQRMDMIVMYKIFNGMDLIICSVFIKLQMVIDSISMLAT